MFKHLLCNHVVKIERYHPTVVPKEMETKVLYVDKLGVWNFVGCTKCGKIFNTAQYEKLFETADL